MDIYHATKSFGDVIAGSPTQRIRENKIEKANDQYCANLGMKINAKLGGVNSLPERALAILPTSSTDIYHAIKSFGDVIAGSPTQRIRENKIKRANDQYCANLGMKINAKLEGVNSLPNPQQVLTILPTSSTDIYHPILPTSSTDIYHAIPPIISSTTSSHSLSTTRLIMPIPISRCRDSTLSSLTKAHIAL
jgi:hypothetical protein